MKKMLVTAIMVGTGATWAADTPPQAPEANEAEAAAAPENQADGVTVKRGVGGEVEEYRVGGRLESMTIDRDRGTTDYWYDRRGDTTWEAGQEEVDQKENLRQWKLGNW